MATSAPSAARPSAIALPIPRPPPVTSATRVCPFPPVTCCSLLVGEAGRPLLHERLHGLGEVAREARQDLRAVLEVDARLEAPDLELAPHDLLGHADSERAVADDELGGFAC